MDATYEIRHEGSQYVVYKNGRYYEDGFYTLEKAAEFIDSDKMDHE